MIKGQQIFTEHFKEFQDCYVVIGGLAVDAHMESQGLSFRATKDFDIILILEALRPEFFTHFWQFIIDGDYQQQEVIEGERQYYRFIGPTNEEYPHQIELFSKKPDVIPEIEGHQLIPIPADDDISSLSAILMDENYYEITKKNTEYKGGLSIASEPLLICLKIKAYLDLSKRKEVGHKVDSRTIKKHRSDVFRLGVTLTGEEKMQIPDSIHDDIEEFIKIIAEQDLDLKHILKQMGIVIKINVEDVIEIIRSIFIKK